LACSRDDTLKLIELRENRVLQTFRFVRLNVLKKLNSMFY